MVFCYWFYADLLTLILVGSYCFVVGSYFTTASSFISIAVTFLRAAENFLSVASVFLSVANAFISVADFYSRHFWAINSVPGSVNSTAIGLITMLGKVLSVASINFSIAGKNSRDCRFCFLREEEGKKIVVEGYTVLKGFLFHIRY